MTTTFAEFVTERFGGTLYSGSHDPNGHACLHEALNVYQGKPWSDDTSGTIDLRSLNDARWSSDAVRTEHMIPLGSLVLAWSGWPEERRQAFAKYVSEQTIRRILPPMLRAVAERVPSQAPALIAAALRCETDGDAYAAADAAYAAYSAAGSAADAADAAYSAYSAAGSAAYAAYSAAGSAADAAYSAYSAAGSAADAAYSAARSAAGSAHSAADTPLIEACRIFAEGAEEGAA